jgi:hypothetical protein
MIFKKKAFFLDLGGSEGQQPASVAPVKPAAAPKPKQAKGAAKTAEKPATAPTAAPAAEPTAGSGGAVLTTAEAIAAELAAAQASRPAPSQATFAPDCLAPSGALPRRRRRGGADLGGFKEMAKAMLRS